MNQHSETDLQALMSGNPMKNKTQNELASLVSHLFQNPEVLNFFIQDLGGKFTSDQTNHHYKSNHGIDIEILLKFYENIDRLNLNQSIQ